jgi:hypothetical protein
MGSMSLAGASEHAFSRSHMPTPLRVEGMHPLKALDRPKMYPDGVQRTVSLWGMSSIWGTLPNLAFVCLAKGRRPGWVAAIVLEKN